MAHCQWMVDGLEWALSGEGGKQEQRVGKAGTQNYGEVDRRWCCEEVEEEEEEGWSNSVVPVPRSVWAVEGRAGGMWVDRKKLAYR